MDVWIYFTLLAAFMQAFRTAGQKQLSVHLNAMATTCVRYLYALPFAWGYLLWLLHYKNMSAPALTPNFIKYASIASVSQILGTVFLVIAFRYRNFAVATSLSKTEAIQIAVIGALLFAAPLSFWGWISVVVGVLGVFIVSKVKLTAKDIFQNPGAGFGLASGLGLAITTLLMRESSLALNSDLIVSAAVTLVFLITAQSILTVIYLAVVDRKQFMLMFVHWRLALFVGITSVLGSIGWCTATSFQTAAYVKALGQIEFFITLFLTYRLFKEKIRLMEYLGMVLILASVLILLLWA